MPVDEAWAVLTDLERIAPCMPGAQLTEVEGDEFRGNVKVKVGPITAQYKGVARFAEKDDATHRAVIDAQGRDTRGQGNANALITATLEAQGSGTHVTVNTDLKLTGKVAQFGRGAIADVSAALLDQFVSCLEHDLLSGAAAPTEALPETAPAIDEPAAPRRRSSRSSSPKRRPRSRTACARSTAPRRRPSTCWPWRVGPSPSTPSVPSSSSPWS